MRLLLKIVIHVYYKVIGFCNNLHNMIVLYKENVKTINYNINGRVFIRNKGKITLGRNFRANSGRHYNPIGGDSILRLICYENAKLDIGNNVGMSNLTIVCKNEITLGNNILLGGGCKIWDTDFHSLDYRYRNTKEDIKHVKSAPININSNVFIGAGSIILKGVTIGEKSIIAAGSVVSKSIPAGEIWGGNPAKFIKKVL